MKIVTCSLKTAVALLFTALSLCPSAQCREVVDMRGVTVTVPDNIRRVATIDDGFVEGVLTHLNEIDKVKAIGSWSMKRDYKYAFPSENGQTYTRAGWNTMKLLHPWLNDVPCVNSPQGNIINYEALVKADPDVVILRVGDCTVSAGNQDNIRKTIQTIEQLGLPLVVLYSPSATDANNLSGMIKEGETIGALFGKGSQAKAFMESLSEIQTLIHDRLKDIPEAERKKVLYLGLNPGTRQNGGAGRALGTKTPESWMLESLVNAKNAFAMPVGRVDVSAEQVYAMDPDVILLPTDNGYHPREELLSAPYYRNLKELRAVKEGKVFPMPWSPMNCARRVEYPLDLLIMAKAVYPDRFKDIDVYQYAKDFYKKAYGVDDATAEKLRSTQILDWMKDINF